MKEEYKDIFKPADHISEKEWTDYIDKKLSPKDQQRIEKVISNSALLREAEEGAKHTNTSSIHDASKNINQLLFQQNKKGLRISHKNTFQFLGIAASITLVVYSSFLFFSDLNQKDEKSVSETSSILYEEDNDDQENETSFLSDKDNKEEMVNDNISTEKNIVYQNKKEPVKTQKFKEITSNTDTNEEIKEKNLPSSSPSSPPLLAYKNSEEEKTREVLEKNQLNEDKINQGDNKSRNTQNNYNSLSKKKYEKKSSTAAIKPSTFGEGMSYYQQGNIDMAIDRLEKITKKDRNYSQTQYFLGNLYKEKQKTKKAIKAFENNIEYIENQYYMASLWNWSQLAFKESKTKHLRQRLEILIKHDEYKVRAQNLMDLLDTSE